MRVSILIFSPVLMNSGTWMLAPVSSTATLLPPPAARSIPAARQGISASPLAGRAGKHTSLTVCAERPGPETWQACALMQAC